MTSKRLRQILYLTTILVFVGLCFLTKWTSVGVCIFCQTKTEDAIFTQGSEHFLLVPHSDCSSNPPFLVILVTSSPADDKVRIILRETWGKKRLIANKLIVTYFLLGTALNPEEQVAVIKESLKYGDIIQKDFIDTYYNLTLKTMMGIEWIHKFCSQSNFVMKTDSDVFVNTYYLTQLLLKNIQNTRFFTGFLKLNEHPIRLINSKWYVSKNEYPGNVYPPFCSGTGYVFSTDVASLVYRISDYIPFVKLEDVFIGLCLAELDIKLVNLHSKQIFFPDGLQFSPCRFQKIVTSHHVKSQDMVLYWNALERSMDETCPDG